jgi:hypothetical protein
MGSFPWPAAGAGGAGRPADAGAQRLRSRAVRGRVVCAAVAGAVRTVTWPGQAEAGSRVRCRVNALARVVAQGQVAGRRRARWRAWATRRPATRSIMSGFDGELPSFILELDDAVGLLERHRSPALGPADRAGFSWGSERTAGMACGARGTVPAAARKPACREPAPKRRRSGAARFRTGVGWADRVGSRRPGRRRACLVVDADREVIRTMRRGRRLSCRRRQPDSGMPPVRPRSRAGVLGGVTAELPSCLVGCR